MKAFSKYLGSAALAGIFGFSAVSAFAADMIEQAPEPAPVEVMPSESTGWAGPYVGAYGHWNKGETRAPGMTSRTKPEGYGGGVFGGYQLQDGSIVYGAEADVGYGNAEGRNAVIGAKTGVEGSLRARLGFAPSDRVLVYGTAGGAAGNVKVRDVAAGTADTNTMLGYTVGAGVDAKITDKVFGRVEYRYTDLGKDKFNIGGGQRVGQETSAVRLGLGLKF
jgi:outer membrane immunogenic protein